jgi:hypothetical protein
MKKKDLKELRTLAATYPFTHVPHYIAVQYRRETIQVPLELGIVKTEEVTYIDPVMCRVNHARRMRRAAQRGGANGLAEYYDKVSAKAEKNIPVMEFHRKSFKEKFMAAV